MHLCVCSSVPAGRVRKGEGRSDGAKEREEKREIEERSDEGRERLST